MRIGPAVPGGAWWICAAIGVPARITAWVLRAVSLRPRGGGPGRLAIRVCMPAGFPARAVALAYMLWPTLGRAPQSEPLSTLRILRESEAARLDSSATRQPAP